MNIFLKYTKYIKYITLCVATVAAFDCAAPAPRLSFNVVERYNAPRFTSVALATGSVAVLPFLTANGTVSQGGFNADTLYQNITAQRPDLTFVPHSQFENAFPPRFDRRQLPVFYNHLFNGDELAVLNLDSLWGFVAQDFLLTFALRDGAAIKSANGKYFKHVSVVSEIWGRETRRVMWRVSCRGVTDDPEISENDLIAECLDRFALMLPAAAPTTLGLPGATSSRRQ